MSLEMISNPDPGKTIDAKKAPKLGEALRILNRTGVIKTAEPSVVLHGDAVELPAELRAGLLDAAWDELQAIRRYLTLPHVIWRSFWHREERGILKQYWRLQHRQSFHDGVCVALLLVAVRRALNDTDGRAPKRPQEADVPPGPARKLRHARTTRRIATAIAGDISDIVQVVPLGSDRTTRQPPQLTKSLRTRRQPWQCSTRSWQAAYNLACAYAAIAHGRQRGPEAAAKTANTEADPDKLVKLVLTSLEFAVSVPECELEHPCEWIAVDPDFGCLRFSQDEASETFRDFLTAQKQRDYPAGSQDGSQDQAGPGLDEAGNGRTARPATPSASIGNRPG